MPLFKHLLALLRISISTSSLSECGIVHPRGSPDRYSPASTVRYRPGLAPFKAFWYCTECLTWLARSWVWPKMETLLGPSVHCTY